MSTMSKEEMMQRFKESCEQEGYHYSQDEDNPSEFSLDFSLENSIGAVHNILFFNEGFVDLVGRIDASAGNRRDEVGEFLMRINKTQGTGHFQLDYDNDTIFYQTDIDYDTIENEEHLACNFTDEICNPFACHGDFLMKVILGVLTPKEAYEEDQKQQEEDSAEE